MKDSVYYNSPAVRRHKRFKEKIFEIWYQLTEFIFLVIAS